VLLEELADERDQCGLLLAKSGQGTTMPNDVNDRGTQSVVELVRRGDGGQLGELAAERRII
jgi:hypothetical protein